MAPPPSTPPLKLGRQAVSLGLVSKASHMAVMDPQASGRLHRHNSWHRAGSGRRHSAGPAGVGWERPALVSGSRQCRGRNGPATRPGRRKQRIRQHGASRAGNAAMPAIVAKRFLCHLESSHVSQRLGGPGASRFKFGRLGGLSRRGFHELDEAGRLPAALMPGRRILPRREYHRPAPPAGSLRHPGIGGAAGTDRCGAGLRPEAMSDMFNRFQTSFRRSCAGPMRRSVHVQAHERRPRRQRRL